MTEDRFELNVPRPLAPEDFAHKSMPELCALANDLALEIRDMELRLPTVSRADTALIRQTVARWRGYFAVLQEAVATRSPDEGPREGGMCIH